MYLSKVLKKHLLNFPMTVIDEDDIYQLKKNFCCRQLSVSNFFLKKKILPVNVILFALCQINDDVVKVGNEKIQIPTTSHL